MLTIKLQRRKLSIMKNKRFKVGTSLAALTTLVPMVMPLVGAEEAGVAQVQPAEATQAKAISLEIVNKNSAQGTKFTSKSPVTLRAKIKLPAGVKEGTVTLALNDQFKFLENKVTGEDGQETTEVSKIRILKGNTVHRDLDGSQLPTVKDEKKGDAPVPADAKEETTVAENHGNENQNTAENKTGELTSPANVETTHSETPHSDVATEVASQPKASNNVMFNVVEEDLEDGVLTLEVDLMPVEDEANVVRELEVKFQPKGEATEIAEKASITLEKANDVAPYITKFVDAEGNALADEQSGEAFADAKEIEGYVLEKTEENDHVRTHTYKKVSAETPETPANTDGPDAQSQATNDANSDANGGTQAGDTTQSANDASGKNGSKRKLPNTGVASIAGAVLAGVAGIGGAVVAAFNEKKGKGLK